MLKIKETRLLFYIIITFILILKIYLLFITPRNLEYFVTGNSSFNYFNTQSFFNDPKSYYAVHNGTPIYLIGSLILKIVGTQITDFYKYFYIHHLIIFVITAISIKNFIYFFKKYLKIHEQFLILIILISSNNFIYSLEIVDLISYQLSLSILSITYLFKSFEKEKKNYKLAAILILVISSKISFLPFFLIILFIKILDSAFNKKKIFTFLLLLCIFYIIFNITNLLRPFIEIINIFLSSDEIFINHQRIINILKILIYEKATNNFFVLIIEFFFILLNLKIFINLIRKKIIKKKITILILNYLLLACFIYTQCNAADQILKYGYDSVEKENIFRNSYFYIFFIMTTFIVLNTKYSKNLNIYFIIFSFLIFILSFNNYLFNRKIYIQNNVNNANLLKINLSKIINFERSIIGIYRYGYAYGLGDHIFFFEGNGAYGNERFNDQIISLYPNFRWIRIPQILAEIEKTYSVKYPEKSKISIIKDDYENFLKKNFNNFFYNILTINNYFIYPNKSFNNEIYTNEKKINFSKADVLIFGSKFFTLEKINLIDKYIDKNLHVKKKNTIHVNNDIWHVYILNYDVILK